MTHYHAISHVVNVPLTLHPLLDFVCKTIKFILLRRICLLRWRVVLTDPYCYLQKRDGNESVVLTFDKLSIATWNSWIRLMIRRKRYSVFNMNHTICVDLIISARCKWAQVISVSGITIRSFIFLSLMSQWAWKCDTTMFMFNKVGKTIERFPKRESDWGWQDSNPRHWWWNASTSYIWSSVVFGEYRLIKEIVSGYL